MSLLTGARVLVLWLLTGHIVGSGVPGKTASVGASGGDTIHVTIVPHRDSLFSKATLPLWSLLVIVVQWLSGKRIANTARVAATSNATVIRFGTKLKKFAQKYMKLYPHQFNRNPISVTCVGKCSVNCNIFLMATNSSSVLLHNLHP